MIFPERPTCHDRERPNPDGWRWRPPHHTPYRTCAYCGSIHPEDLLAALATGTQMSGSDWKYGWPAKFYLDPYTDGKWYSIHLTDAGYDYAALAALLAALTNETGITWASDPEKGVSYAAPYHGYQQASTRERDAMDAMHRAMDAQYKKEFPDGP